MFRKLNALCTAGYLKAAGFVQELKKDERGLSGVVVAVLLILVAVLAISLLWSLLQGQLLDWWEQITGVADGIS